VISTQQYVVIKLPVYVFWYFVSLGTNFATGGGHSVGIVRVRTKATEFSFF